MLQHLFCISDVVVLLHELAEVASWQDGWDLQHALVNLLRNFDAIFSVQLTNFELS